MASQSKHHFHSLPLEKKLDLLDDYFDDNPKQFGLLDVLPAIPTNGQPLEPIRLRVSWAVGLLGDFAALCKRLVDSRVILPTHPDRKASDLARYRRDAVNLCE